MVALTGAPGVVALLWAVPAALAALVWASRAAGRSRRGPVLLAAGVMALTVASPMLGVLAQGPGGQVVRVAMVSVPTGSDGPARLDSDAGRQVLAASLDGVRRAAAQGARYVVLGESSLWLSRGDLPQVEAELRAAAGTRTAVVMGVVVQDSDGQDDGGQVRNTALLVTPDSGAEYYKRHLVPGSEAGVVPGEETLVADVLGERVGLVICKDLDFPWTIRESARAGARLVLAPAWDFTVDGWQHSQMATVRAAEGGFALVRPARDGLNIVADHRGRVVASTSTVSKPEQVVVTDVRVGGRTTPYSLLGDWVVVVGVGVLAGITLRGLRRR